MKVKKSTAACLAASGVLCIIGAQRFKLPLVFEAAGIVLALYGPVRFLRIVESERNLKAINHALDDLDIIHGGLRIIGRESDALDWRRADVSREPGPVEVAQLCRTRNGQWFEHCFALRHGRTSAHIVKLLDESEARFWLSYDGKAFERVFGPAPLA
jgi:hypothetical protein